MAADAALRILETRDAVLGPDAAATTQTVLRESLSATLGELHRRLGPQLESWTWGGVHTLELKPPFGTLLRADEFKAMTIGPHPVGGSGTTVALAAPNKDLTAVHGPSVRIVMDVGDWDKSVFMNMPGQSADASSPHYGDFLPGWLAGEFAPMTYTRPAVEKVAERVISLTPGR